jgi:hypothetical protein
MGAAFTPQRADGTRGQAGWEGGKAGKASGVQQRYKPGSPWGKNHAAAPIPLVMTSGFVGDLAKNKFLCQVGGRPLAGIDKEIPEEKPEAAI